jgi:hypothetical protein
MTALYNFNPPRFRDVADCSDVKAWQALYDSKIVNYGISFADRTGVIKIPLKTAVAPQNIMPAYDPCFNMTYEECCQLSAQKLFERQDRLDVPIRLLYSGGIDSSTILASLIKQVGLAEVEKRVELVLNPTSIEENRWMWEKVIRRSKIRFLTSETHEDWTSNRILVAGEGNDQLFGSDLFKDLQQWKGTAVFSALWSDELIYEYLHTWKHMPQTHADTWTRLMSAALRAAPCPVETLTDWWWWINFTCKWSCVYFRIANAVSNPDIIDQSYMDDYFCQFFNTEHHQKWSMVDRVNKHKNTQDSYKYHAKELICSFLGDNGYMIKAKRGSLWEIMAHKKKAMAIDANYSFYWDIPDISDYYEPNNSFR